MVDLAGKTAIVTGAAVGIGPAYAEALADEGCNIAVCDIREEIMDLVPKLEAKGAKVKAWVADVSVPDDVRTVVDGTIEAFGGIDILVSNAGKCWVSVADDDLDKMEADYDGMVGTNLKGEFMIGRAVIAQLLKQGRGGEIVNIATDHMATCGSPFELCTKENCPNQPHPNPRPTGGGEVMDIYDASKWGLNGFLFAWAKALRPQNIRVNALCMGATDSWMIRDFFGFPQTKGEETEEQRKEVDSWMAKEDTAQVLVDLLKEGPQGRTAQNINLCIGRPTVLEPPLPHIYIQEESVNV